MPKTFLNEYDRRMAAFRSWLKGKMAMQNITQSAMAEKLNCTQANFSCKMLGKTAFSQKELMIVFKSVNATDEEIVRYMK